MTRIRSLSAAAAMALLTSSAAHAATITGLWNTGVDASNVQLGEGALDTHYLVNGSGTPVVYDNAAYITTSDARFIAVQQGGGYISPINTYTLNFSLAGLKASTAQLSGGFAADNYGSVYLNDHLLAQDAQGTYFSDFQQLTSFSAGASDFLAGNNVLKFVITDTGAPSAFLVSGLSGTAAVPEPATWAMMLLGLFGLGAALRASGRKPQAGVASV